VMLCLVHAGKRVGFLPNPDELPKALATFRPTILVTVPRMLEKAAAAARLRAESEGRRRLFDAAACLKWGGVSAVWSLRGGRLPLRRRTQRRRRVEYSNLGYTALGLVAERRWLRCPCGAAPDMFAIASRTLGTRPARRLSQPAGRRRLPGAHAIVVRCHRRLRRRPVRQGGPRCGLLVRRGSRGPAGRCASPVREAAAHTGRLVACGAAPRCPGTRPPGTRARQRRARNEDRRRHR